MTWFRDQLLGARNCSSSARSLEISSELLSSSDVPNLSVGIDGGVVGDDSPDESWSVSSNTSSPSSDKSTGDSASSSIVAWVASVRFMFGGRQHFGAGIGGNVARRKQIPTVTMTTKRSLKPYGYPPERAVGTTNEKDKARPPR